MQATNKLAVLSAVALCYLLCTPMAAAACASGRYKVSAMSCPTCFQGYYCPGDDNYYPCPAGKFNPSLAAEAATACQNCGPGTYSAAGSVSCTQCPAGTYNPNSLGSSVAACTKCPVGTFNPNTGSQSVVSCLSAPPGSYVSTTGSTDIISCAVGYYSVGYANTACTACPAGTTTSTTGCSACESTLSCVAGSYVAPSGTSCLPCPAGQFSSTKNAPSCTLCPQGTYLTSTGASSASACTKCPTGTYGEQEGATSVSQCVLCPAGTYNANAGASSSGGCRQCPPGRYSDQAGATALTQCLLCAAGTYASYAGATSCEPCGRGTYSDAIGSTSSSSCFPCPSGTFRNDTGGSNVASCAVCPPGSFSPARGGTECFLCDAGYYTDQVGATACLPCPLGTYGPNRGFSSVSQCVKCAAGTYGLSPASVSAAAACVPCSSGLYSSRVGATSFSVCRQCPAGTFATTTGTSECTACPQGTYSSIIGSSTSDDCLPCDAGTYSNSTGADACVPCHVGSFQNETGKSSCRLCEAGSDAPTIRSTSCRLCDPGSYAADRGTAQCRPCPSGTLQLTYGGTSCAPCPRDYADLPLPFPTVLESDVCRAFQNTIVLNWGPVTSPPLLAVNATILSVLPPWLTAAVKGGVLLPIVSDMIPPGASRRGVVVQVAVGHTCRAMPQVSNVTLQLYRSDPVFFRSDATIGAEGIEACPTFAVQYTAVLGTCAAQTTVIATFLNGSALPPYISFVFSNSVVEIAGTIPRGVAPFEVVAVAQLGTEVFVSVPTRISLAVSSGLFVSGPATTSGAPVTLRACPYVSVMFRVSRQSNCGRLRFVATLANGEPLPSYLSHAVAVNRPVGENAATLTIFGTVPSNQPTLSVMAAASTGGDWANSTAVPIVRPALTDTANVTIAMNDGNSSRSQLGNNRSTSTSNTALLVEAPYGRFVHLTVRIDAGPGGVASLCSSLALSVSASPPGSDNGEAVLPAWVTVAATSSTSLLLSATPTVSQPRGTIAVIYVWANDGLRNPGFNLTIAVQDSLLPLTPPSDDAVPQVITPASLLELTVAVEGGDAMEAKPRLICPDSSAGAFCSFSAEASVLGSFGTARGVNSVLQGLRVVVTPSSRSLNAGSESEDHNNNISLSMTFRETVNPEALVLRVPLAALPSYVGVSSTQPLQLTATVGKPFSASLLAYFDSRDGEKDISFALLSATSWISLQGDQLVGTPGSPPRLEIVSVVVSDRFTTLAVNGTVNISWPMNPIATDPPLSRWFVATSTQLDVQLPLNLIVDPENGTLTFDLRLFDGSKTGQPLPSFLSFDASSQRFSGTPQSKDVGSFPLILIGRSSYGSWSGEAVVPMVVSVEESWADFFARVYEYVGYAGSLLALITWSLVHRATLMNLVLFRWRFRVGPPAALCRDGEYTLGTGMNSIDNGGGDAIDHHPSVPTPSSRVQEVRVRYLSHKDMTTRWYLPDYIAMHNRCADVPLKTDFLGAPWLRAAVTLDRTVLLRVNRELLRSTIAAGVEAQLEDMYYLEVLQSGMWSEGTLLEAFTFQLRDLLDGGTAGKAHNDKPSMMLMMESSDAHGDVDLDQLPLSAASPTEMSATPLAVEKSAHKDVAALKQSMRQLDSRLTTQSQQLEQRLDARLTSIEEALPPSWRKRSQQRQDETSGSNADPYRQALDADPLYLGMQISEKAHHDDDGFELDALMFELGTNGGATEMMSEDASKQVPRDPPPKQHDREDANFGNVDGVVMEVSAHDDDHGELALVDEGSSFDESEHPTPSNEAGGLIVEI